LLEVRRAAKSGVSVDLAWAVPTARRLRFLYRLGCSNGEKGCLDENLYDRENGTSRWFLTLSAPCRRSRLTVSRLYC